MGKNNKIIAVIFILLVIIISSYIYKNLAKNNEESSMMKDKKTLEGYNGELLAGNESPYLAFNQEDYNKARADNKIIFLDFYANWCPICKKEQPETFAAFNDLSSNNIIGFRVNYKDSETDENEVALAKEFGISYQHTKVIIKDGKQVLKAPDSWNKERVLEELNKFS